MRTRTRGFTLAELMISLILAGVLGVIVAKVLVTTSRFYGRDAAARGARQVSRSALGLMESELRMVEVANGLVSADSLSITVRTPYAFGILCTSGGSTATASLLPVDSLVYASAGFSGYAWRDSTGGYTTAETGVVLGAGYIYACAAQSITTLPGGRIATLKPAPPASIPVGTPVMLFQRVTYRFAPSAALPGRTGLWRDVAATGVSEELVAPFDAASRFAFYVLNADTAQARAPSPLSLTRGVDLVLAGASERAPLGRSLPETATLNTAIFFRNRTD